MRDFLVAAPGFTVDGAAVAAVIVSGTTGFAVIGTVEGDAAIPTLGSRVHDIGDADNDGIGDFALAAPDDGNGRLFAYLSQAGNRVELTAPGLTELAGFGATVTTVGDLDGDNIDELLVAAPRQTVGQNNNPECADVAPAGYAGNCTGLVYLVVGGAIDVAAAGGETEVTGVPCLQAPDSAERLGTALRALGIRGTATRVAAGAPGVAGAAGSVHIFDLGADGSCPAAPEQTLSRGSAGDFFGAALGR